MRTALGNLIPNRFLIILILAIISIAGANRYVSRREQELLQPPATTQMPCSATQPDGEGPYYVPDIPYRNSMIPPEFTGSSFLLSGTVRQASGCLPLTGVVLDIWQTNPDGVYENDWYRAKVVTDKNGSYHVVTSFPGVYEPRPPHIHVKLTPPGGETLITQLYLEQGPTDRLLMLENVSGTRTAVFDFIIP